MYDGVGDFEVEAFGVDASKPLGSVVLLFVLNESFASTGDSDCASATVSKDIVDSKGVDEDEGLIARAVENESEGFEDDEAIAYG